MQIVARLDVMLARRKMRSREPAERVGITEQNLSSLKSGRVKGIRFDTVAAICGARDCQPGDILEACPDGEAALGGIEPPKAALPRDDLHRSDRDWPGPPAGVFG